MLEFAKAREERVWESVIGPVFHPVSELPESELPGFLGKADATSTQHLIGSTLDLLCITAPCHLHTDAGS